MSRRAKWLLGISVAIVTAAGIHAARAHYFHGKYSEDCRREYHEHGKYRHHGSCGKTDAVRDSIEYR